MQDKLKQSLKLVNYCGAAAAALVLVAVVILGIMPMRRSGRADNAAAGELRGSIDRLEQLSQANTLAQAHLQYSEARLAEAEQRLASGPPDAVFNNELSTVAKDSGIRIENMPPVSQPRKVGPYNTVQVTVIGSGDWKSCYRFLAGLRAMKQIARLDSVTMDVQDKAGALRSTDKVSCQITVKFSTFYMER